MSSEFNSEKDISNASLLTKFSTLRNQINVLFDSFIDQMNIRRNKLLEKLEEIESKESSDIDNSSNTEWMFVFDNTEIINAIDTLGDVVQSNSHYYLKSVSNLGIPKSRIIEPVDIAVDEERQLVFITDLKFKCVHIIKTSGEYIQKFGHDYFQFPWAILLVDNRLYVTDGILGTLRMFISPNRSFSDQITSERVVTFQEKLTSLASDGEKIYATASGVHALLMCDLRLKFIDRYFDNTVLTFPQHVRFNDKDIFICDSGSPCMHIFDKDSKQHIRSIIPRGLHSTLKNSPFFALDREGCIVMSDYSAHDIKIYTPSGHLLQVISKEGHQSNELYQPRGLYVTMNFHIYVVSNNRNYSLQCF